uniref:Putative spatzle alternatively spliced isoform n=1 Tax=Ornithodoros turicata TaxID=34597 RepID=A0A2R5LKR9_9ACAR
MKTWGPLYQSYFQNGEEEEFEDEDKKKSELRVKEDEQQVRTPFGGAPEAQVCDTQKEVRYPRIGLDKDGLMRIIINTGSEYRQPVLIEKCRNEDGTCGRIHDMLPAGHTTRCATKYVNRVLVALPLDGNAIEPVPTKFSFPAACVCFVRTYYYPGKD